MQVVYIIGIALGFIGIMGGMWFINKPKTNFGYVIGSAAGMFCGLAVLILSLLLLFVPNFFKG